MKRIAIVGCGARGLLTYANLIITNFSDCAEICGVYDSNYKRAEIVKDFSENDIPVFNDFDKMLDEVKPDTVIIATKDSEHDYYIIRAMNHGCDVICEKPLTTTFEKAILIKETQEKTGKDIKVTFNLRFHPFFKRVKEIVSSGAIGKILSVHFEWMLDTNHGADYFRRWHREYKNSGSLLVHKSTHHFDLVNWFIEEDPVCVNAFGTRRFYGPVRSERSERCLTCPYKNKCEFYFDINAFESDVTLYSNCEDVDGYYRDGCVFSDVIDIEDSVCVNVSYSGGAVMCYSLTAHSPYEGVHLVLNGTDGRMEISFIMTKSSAFDISSRSNIKIYNRLGELININVPEDNAGGHGGADPQLINKLLRYPSEADTLEQAADLRAGLMSIGIGMAANISMKENRRVMLSEFYNEDILKQR